MNPQRHWMLRSLHIVVALTGLGLLAPIIFAQAPLASTQLTAGPSYTSGAGNAEPNFPNIDLVFKLRSSDGSAISAQPGNLRLFAQGQQIGTATSIRTFEQTGYGVTAILALDVSDSIKGEPPDAIHASIATFLNQARPQDKVAMLTFADKTQVDIPFGTSPAALANELKAVKDRGEFTRLYDGIIDALALFTNSQPKRRQLLVISDGHDQGSHHTIIDAVLRAKSLGVVIDSIGLTNDRSEYLVFLQQLSLETGGTYVRAQSAQQLEALIGQGIQATRATPVAAFQLKNVAEDGKLLSTQLRWQPGNLSATAFIQTPKGKLTPKLIPTLSSLWIWGLIGCFVAGVILLALSWRGPRPQPEPRPTAVANYSGPALRNSGLPQSVPFSPIIDQRASPEALRKSAFRAPTLVEAPLAVYFDAPASGPFARLVMKNGTLAGQSVPVTTTDFSLGAVQGNNLLLPGDPAISGQHARLHWENSTLHIEDINSTNGTWLNRLRLSPGRHLLKPGDEIGMGQTIVVVKRA